MRNQHVIYHKQIHKHYSHARTLTIILLQILKHSFKILNHTFKFYYANIVMWRLVSIVYIRVM